MPLVDAGTLAGILLFTLERNAWCIGHNKSLAAPWLVSVVISDAQQQIQTSRAEDRLRLSNTSRIFIAVPTTQNEIEVGDFVALLVDGVVPVDGFKAHAPAQALPCLFRQLGQEGIQKHQGY